MLVGVLVGAVGVRTATAQSLSFGELGGSVRDASGTPVRGAEIRVVERASGALRWVPVGIDGRFRFAVLPAGRYDVTAEALGFRPLITLDVEVAPGRSIELAMTLQPTSLPATAIDTAHALRPGSSRWWLADRGYGEIAGARRVLGDVATLSTFGDGGGLEGLPWRYTEVMIDGTRSTISAVPGADGGEMAGLAFPLRGIAGSRVGGLGYDVEVGGSGIGIAANSLRGARVGELKGSIEGGSLSSGGALIASGGLEGDTTQAVVGIDYQRGESSLPPSLGDSPLGSAYLGAAAGASGTDLTRFAEGSTRLDERIGAFGRLDFQPGDRVAVAVRASGSRHTSSGLLETTGDAARLGTDYEALAAHASANLFARIGRRFTQELRVSTDVATATSAADALPATTLAGVGLRIGSSPYGRFDESHVIPRASAILHGRFGDHQLKVGLSAAVHRIDSRRATRSGESFVFGDPTDLSNLVGTWTSVGVTRPAGEFAMSERALFLQDSWSPVDGLSLSLGARWDASRLPVGEIERNEEWLSLSGVDNRSVRRSRGAFSPRMGVRWELGSRREWLIEGGAGVFHDLPDRHDLSEVLAMDLGAEVRRGAGALGSWPEAPSLATAPVVGRTLSLLGPDFAGPRTRRLSIGLARTLAEWSVSAAAVYRYTDLLSRRRDLNLPAAPLATDQYGRPLYGTLEQHGPLLTSVTGANRRFAEFDAVHALEATGYSDHWSLSLGTQRLVDRGVSVSLGYTFSRTEDNVPGFGRRAMLTPFPEGLAGVDWTEGTSDLDVPHRLVAAFEWAAGAASPVRLGVIYRLRSGTPFTPGFRDGVDANGDGSASLDPAFIDPDLPGMDALLEENDCLRDAVRTFASRNSCRAGVVSRLDLRAAFRVARIGSGRLDLIVDAIDVLGGARGQVDQALYLVDRGGTLSHDAVAGVTTVPLVVNPSFGKVIADRAPDLLWRVGLRITP